MCSKRCKASHEQGRYCRATDFQDPSNPSTIVGHVVVSVICILGLAFSPMLCKNCWFSVLHLLESLKLPLFTLLCTQGSASEQFFWHGRKKWDSYQYQLAVHFNLEKAFSWTKQKPAAYFLKACAEFWANPSTFKLKCTRRISSPEWVVWFEAIASSVLHFSLFSSIAERHVLLLLAFREACTWYSYFCNGLP